MPVCFFCCYILYPYLSDTQQVAGGVGGLVAVSINGQYYFPCYDNLGNVVAYVDESGTKVASYTYDAFGFTLSASGSMRDTFPHRFSTKWQDNYTLLYDYGYRWYWPDIGRWMNRDPIGEEGGENLYSFSYNAGPYLYDDWGLIVSYTIRTIGDSMTYGVRTVNDPLRFQNRHENTKDNASRVNVRINQGWRGYLMDRLNAWAKQNSPQNVAFDFVGYHAESDVPGNVPHDGYPGVRASEYLTKYKHVCFDKGDIYIVFLGMNDATSIARHERTSWQEHFSNTKKGFDAILSNIPDNENTFLLLVKPPHMTNMTDPRKFDKTMINAVLDHHIYNMIDTATTGRIGAVSVVEFQHSDGTDDDGFHFSDLGNRKMAELLFQKIHGFVINPSQFVQGGKQ